MQEGIREFFQAHTTLEQILQLILMAVLTTIAVLIILRIEKKISKKLLTGKKTINRRFVENILRGAVILVAVMWVMMSNPLTQSFGRVLFQGTAILGAVAGIAAQPILADLFCGIMLSSAKPFDIGDRIELENGTAGIVKDITLRHVVLQGIDTVTYVIPNSKLNGMQVTNMSYHSTLRSVHFRFGVSYDTDTAKAQEVIGRAVKESPYTVPGKPSAEGNVYGPVYFLAFEESSLVMGVTVYYEPTVSTEMMKSDVNSRVRQALRSAGIEIPYNYLNIIEKNENKRS